MWERRAIATAEALEFPSGSFSSAFVSVYLAWVRMITGNRDEAREFGRRTIEIAERCRFDYLQLLGKQYVLLPEPDCPCDVTELMQYGVGMDLVGHAAFRATYLAIVAQNHFYMGDADLALQSLDEAMNWTRTSGELVHQPDLLRLRADITAAAHPDLMDDAAEDLVVAVEIGLAQGSLVHALRAANHLARLPHDSRPSDWSARIRRRTRAVPTQLFQPRTCRSAEPSRDLKWGLPSTPISAMELALCSLRSSSPKGDWTNQVRAHQRSLVERSEGPILGGSPRRRND